MIRHLGAAYFLNFLLPFLNLLILPNQGAEAKELRQYAYGVHDDFQEIAHTRLLQLKERTALDCIGAGSEGVIWYRKSLRVEDAALGDEEQILVTLLVDWKWTSEKEKEATKHGRPHQFKFELTTSSNNDSRLIIHDGRWHDLGQYYCVKDGEVKTIYLVYQRPMILYAQPKERLEENKLVDLSSISPQKLIDYLEKMEAETEETRLRKDEKGVIRSMWRSYPFVDSASSGPKGFKMGGFNWDEGDICKWMKMKKPYNLKDRTKRFSGIEGTDVELLKMDTRYSFSFDAHSGVYEWTVNPVSFDDETNMTLNVETSRGSSYAFLFFRVENPVGYLPPLIAVLAEIVCIAVLTAILLIVDRRKRRKVEEERNLSVTHLPKPALTTGDPNSTPPTTSTHPPPQPPLQEQTITTKPEQKNASKGPNNPDPVATKNGVKSTNEDSTEESSRNNAKTATATPIHPNGPPGLSNPPTITSPPKEAVSSNPAPVSSSPPSKS